MKRRSRFFSAALAAALSVGLAAPAAIAATPTSTTGLWMVALGDSVASGEGIGWGWTYSPAYGGTWHAENWMNPTWAYNQNAPQPICHVSTSAYPYIVSAAMQWHLDDLACTGASALNGVLDKQYFGKTPSGTDIWAHWPQVGNVNPIYQPPSPIYGFEGAHLPDVVTLTLGADDINFSRFVTDCYGGWAGPCDKWSPNNTDIDQLLADQRKNLDIVITSIIDRNTSAGKAAPAIFLTTYYDPFPDQYTECNDIKPTGPVLGLSRGEMSWLKDKLRDLNTNIRIVANRHPNQVTLVPLENVFAGHKWCSADPFAFGPSIDDPWAYPKNPSPFHPTIEGQQAISAAVIAKIKQHFHM